MFRILHLYSMYLILYKFSYLFIFHFICLLIHFKCCFVLFIPNTFATYSIPCTYYISLFLYY